MSIGPLLPGRIPSSLVAQRLRVNLQTGTQLLARLQDQIATGQQFFLPSESPAAAMRTIVLQKTLERQQQYQTSTATSASFLAASDQSLQTVSDGLNRAKGILLQGVGETVTDAERIALADEVRALTRGLIAAANTQFRGRYLFAGSRTDRPPFALTDSGAVSYRGDRLAVESHIENGLILANNVDGATAFATFSASDATDLNPALTPATRLNDMHGGLGVALGSVVVTLENGGPTQIQTIDLTSAKTIEDVQTLLQDAFAAGPLTLTVAIDPATNSGLRLTPSAGTVAVAEVAGGRVAADFGIASAATAVINGGDLDPRLTTRTELAALNGGTGIGATGGTGLVLTEGNQTATVDLSTAVTVEDLFNRLRQSGLDLLTEVDSTGRGLIVASRVNGDNFAIGENGGNNATQLGIRTFTASTRLADLNGGLGVPVDDGSSLTIQRRDGTEIQVDLSGTKTVQQVLDALNAIDPGLVASLNPVGNGIRLIDNSGAGPLIVPDNAISRALGLNGAETGANPTVPLVGRDVNPQESPGMFNILVRLERALRDGDNRELGRLQPLLDREVDRFHVVRGELGSRQRLLDEVENRLADREVQLEQDLSAEFDTDITEIVTQTAQIQTTLEATLRIAAQTSRLTLLSFL